MIGFGKGKLTLNKNSLNQNELGTPIQNQAQVPTSNYITPNKTDSNVIERYSKENNPNYYTDGNRTGNENPPKPEPELAKEDINKKVEKNPLTELGVRDVQLDDVDENRKSNTIRSTANGILDTGKQALTGVANVGRSTFNAGKQVMGGIANVGKAGAGGIANTGGTAIGGIANAGKMGYAKAKQLLKQVFPDLPRGIERTALGVALATLTYKWHKGEIGFDALMAAGSSLISGAHGFEQGYENQVQTNKQALEKLQKQERAYGLRGSGYGQNAYPSLKGSPTMAGIRQGVDSIFKNTMPTAMLFTQLKDEIKDYVKNNNSEEPKPKPKPKTIKELANEFNDLAESGNATEEELENARTNLANAQKERLLNWGKKILPHAKKVVPHVVAQSVVNALKVPHWLAYAISFSVLNADENIKSDEEDFYSEEWDDVFGGKK